MLHSELDSFHYITVISTAFVVQHLERHNLCSSSHTCLSAVGAVSSHCSGTMRTMSLVINRVVVFVHEIIAVMREFAAAVPHVVGDVGVVVVHPGVDYSHHHASASVACRSIISPDIVGIHFRDIPSVAFHWQNRLIIIIFRYHPARLIQINECHIITLCQALDDVIGDFARKTVENPERLHISHDALDICLPALGKLMHLFDDKVAGGLFVHKLRLFHHFRLIILLFHHHDYTVQLVGLRHHRHLK